MAGKSRRPAVEGWFTMDESDPRLIGTRCTACGTVFFPREDLACRNPACGDERLEEVRLSNRGTLWSCTDNRYPPPPPYVAPEPFEPYTIAAVELPEEKLVVLGQVVRGVDPAQLRAGMEMKLVLDTLYEDEAHAYVVWKWQPAA